MPLTSTLVHPRMFSSLQPQFFPSLCSIYPVVEVRNEIGEKIPTPADAMLIGTTPLFEDIPCIIADTPQPVDTEMRTADSTFVSVRRRIMLAGSYPTIVEKMRAAVDGVVYDIRGVDPSPIGSHTELIVEVITI